MKTLSVFILVSITFALTECRVLASEANDVNTLPRYELILGVRSGDCANSVPNPLEFGVRNLNAEKISSHECFEILFRGKVHLLAPDGTYHHSDALGFWRVSEPPAIALGEVAIHPNCGSLEQYFQIRQQGRYLVWWTSGSFRSNTLVFEYADSVFRRLP